MSNANDNAKKMHYLQVCYEGSTLINLGFLIKEDFG